MLQAIEATIYRAGTSRGPYFLANDLPSDKDELDQALLSIMGSGHPLQIDGLGGGNTLTSKVAVVSKSHAPDLYDVDYLFCQVGIAERVVDKGPNCGNMMTGVASFAVERGLVQPDPSATEWVIRVFNINTKQVSELSLPVQNGRVHYDSVDEDGILRPCARVGLRFLDTAGACTGTLLPTGKPFDIIHGIRVSILDSAVPVVFIRQDDVGITGDESSSKLNQNLPLLETLERIRLEAGLRMGLGDVSGSVLPKLSLIRSGRATTTFTARYFTPKTCHNAHAVTGAICTAGAAFTPGTIVWEMYQEQQRAVLSTSTTPILQTPSLTHSPESSTRSSFSSDSGYVEPKLQQTRRISIEHPSGTIDVGLSSSGDALSPTDVPKDLGVAFVERTVALIAHARIYYLTPAKPQAVKSQRLPVLSPEITAFPSAKEQDYFSSRQQKLSTGIPTELQPLTALAARDI